MSAPAVMLSNMAKCGRCKRTLPLEDFPPSKAANAGQWCRQCLRDYSREKTGAVERDVACEWCGTVFRSARRVARYCSNNCKQRALYARRHPKTTRSCGWCGKDISDMRRDAKWCSHNCQERGRQKRMGPEWKRNHALKKYGLTNDSYADLLEKQGGGCAICGRETHPGADLRKLHVDHDHETGRVRGILCANCNRVLGLVGDDPGLLRKAADYLDA